MSGGGNEDDAFPVGDGTGRESANGAIEKFLVLIELDDVIAGAGGGEKTIPRLARDWSPQGFLIVHILHTVSPPEFS
jgi:hypothetical protein